MIKKIEEWLQKSGYPLELFVHKELLKNGYIAFKSELYKDIESGQAREIDLVGYKHGNANGKYSGSLRLIIECKKSEKPCLILTESSNVIERYQQLFGYDFLDHKVQSLGDALCGALGKKSPDSRISIASDLYEKIPTGYSIIQAFSKSDKHLYQGVMGLMKAEKYFHDRATRYFDEMSIQPDLNLVDRYPFELIIPVLVVDTQLYNVSLNPDGELSIVETDWSSVSVSKPWDFELANETNIQIIHKDKTSDFLAMCKSALELSDGLDVSNYLL